MREIKFRAKLVITGELRYFTLADIRGEEHDTLVLEGGYVIVPETIQQFTGLKDKSGKEIYQGDILSYGYGTPREVIWRNGTFCYQESESSYHIFDEKQMEIIGNIYENPELLK